MAKLEELPAAKAQLEWDTPLFKTALTQFEQALPYADVADEVLAVVDVGRVDDGPELAAVAARDAGFGAAVISPLGPIGVDLGYGFDRVDGLGRPAPGWQLHFKLGNFF
mgnify:CR=1 FL=1